MSGRSKIGGVEGRGARYSFLILWVVLLLLKDNNKDFKIKFSGHNEMPLGFHSLLL